MSDPSGMTSATLERLAREKNAEYSKQRVFEEKFLGQSHLRLSPRPRASTRSNHTIRLLAAYYIRVECYLTYRPERSANSRRRWRVVSVQHLCGS